MSEPRPIRVTVWGENRHEQTSARVREIYPHGMHEAIADGLREYAGDQVVVRTAVLDDPEHGLTEEVLSATDVLTWWGHVAHQEVSDEVSQRVRERVLAGMGLIALHSSIHSKVFLGLMGTSCNLRWRETGERQVVWTVAPTHPIAVGLPQPILIPEDEMYCEFFDIPTPDELVLISSFDGGEIFRSGCCFTRGNGRIFFFGPGHETFPVYRQPEVRRVLANAVLWAYNASPSSAVTSTAPHADFGWFDSSEASR